MVPLRAGSEMHSALCLFLPSAIAVIEPTNIFILALMPLLMKGDGPLANCYNRVFTCYDMLFA